MGGVLASLLAMDVRAVQVNASFPHAQGELYNDVHSSEAGGLVPEYLARHLRKSVPLRVVTFGQPRFANPALADYFGRLFSFRETPPVDSLTQQRMTELGCWDNNAELVQAEPLAVAKFYRVAFRKDIVTTIPPEWVGYRHTDFDGWYWMDDGYGTYHCSAVESGPSLLVVLDGPVGVSKKQGEPPKCKYDGFSGSGHISYYWNYDAISAACKAW
jgi:hypothetical protein